MGGASANHASPIISQNSKLLSDNATQLCPDHRHHHLPPPSFPITGQGWGFCGFFRICGFFFSSSNLPHFCRFLQFRALIREREKCGINAYKITLTEPQREMRKNCSQKISLTEPQLSEPLDCERHGQCALSFC